MRRFFTFTSLIFAIYVMATEGELNGRFTINHDGDQVVFSQGNLQYQASTNTWRFAENQYDMVGDDNSTISNINEGWIDLFGWGTSGYNNTNNDPFAINYKPWATSTNQLNQQSAIKGTEIESINCDMKPITGKCDTTWKDGETYHSDDVNYYGYGPSTYNIDKDLTGSNANYDWGIYNVISNGGTQKGVWRTLTYDEWCYIFYNRNLAEYLRSQATVCGVHGYILLPDDFVLPEGLSWCYQTNDWDSNTYTPQEWSTMEAVGAVFLPAAGERYGTEVYYVGEYAYYWSASYYNQRGARGMHFHSGDANMNYYANFTRENGLSVRLIKACDAPTNPTLISQINSDKSPILSKVIKDGQLFILIGENMYSIHGIEVK